MKIDRHKYVRVAYHGFTPISSRTRKDIYSRFFNQVPSFTEKEVRISYLIMFTYFSDVWLLMLPSCQFPQSVCQHGYSVSVC
jgi:hypothetical protein